MQVNYCINHNSDEQAEDPNCEGGSSLYVVLNKDQFGDVIAICVCRFQSTAKALVDSRREKYKEDYCWYQKVEKVTIQAEIY